MPPVRLSANMVTKTYQKGELVMKEKLEYFSGAHTAASEHHWSGHYSFSLRRLRAGRPAESIPGPYAAACGLLLILNCILVGACDLINFRCVGTLSRSGVLYNTSKLLGCMASWA